MGEFDVPVDIEVRVRVVSEVDPGYSWAKTAFKIGPHHIFAPPRRASSVFNRTWSGYDPRIFMIPDVAPRVAAGSAQDRASYWDRSWAQDCMCHTPHRYQRGPLQYVYGDVPTSERGTEPLVLEAGKHEIAGRWICPARGSHSCGSQQVYQQRLRIEFLRCR